MKSLINSFFIAVSMYSSVPVPDVEWNRKNMRNAMCFFPFAGVLCGAALWAVWKICIFFNADSIFFGVLAFAVNIAVTGGIHIDGFCDTNDAVFSRRSPEEKLRIMKDPSCGSFAVLGAIIYSMITAVSYSNIYDKPLLIWQICGIFVVSRVLSGISVTSFKIASSSSLAKLFGENSGKHVRYLLILQLIMIYSLIILSGYKTGIMIIVVSLLLFIYYYRMSDKQFGGITGDLAGFFLVLCETVCIFLISFVWEVLE